MVYGFRYAETQKKTEKQIGANHPGYHHYRPEYTGIMRSCQERVVKVQTATRHDTHNISHRTRTPKVASC